ncbi:DUF924 domain-containing protein [Pseudomonadales bacterium]|nr:DUF924 domain-containing protein [Pseudomonadales bacterium]MDG1938899.1 DUF924 domain-containing protein [Pseudomonadales bacterium]
MIKEAQAVLDFWFGENADDVVTGRDKLWFSGGSEVDLQIKKQFSSLVVDAKEQRLAHWEKNPKSHLALIILLDQFTRNIYRGSAQAFSCDEQVRAICHQGLQQGFDRQLTVSERVFYYLPLEHSELIADQQLCVRLLKQLADKVERRYVVGGINKGVDENPNEYQKMFSSYIEYAVLHHDIIAEYGRFPHRNRLLGRQSTQAELAFLKNDGHSFGQ